MSDGYQNFRKFISERRQSHLMDTANRYSKVNANVRAAVARVAGVEDVRLDEMSAEDRALLFKAVKYLRKKIDSAHLILLGAQTLE